MKIFDLIDEILDEIENGRKSLFGNKKTIEVDFVLEILNEIKEAMPEDLLYAQEVLGHKQEIINQAQEKAKNILDGVDAACLREV